MARFVVSRGATELPRGLDADKAAEHPSEDDADEGPYGSAPCWRVATRAPLARRPLADGATPANADAGLDWNEIGADRRH